MSGQPKCRDAIEALHQAIICAIGRPGTERLETAEFGRYNPEATKAGGWHWHLKFTMVFDQDGESVGDTTGERVTKLLRSWDAGRLRYEEKK